MEINKVYHGKMLDILKQCPDNFFDSCVTDPPYGLNFMGKHWDYKIPPVAEWKEVLRVLKPGGHLLCACGTRTQHRMVVNIEDAGFEIRDVISWIYGSGFPKSLDIAKAIEGKITIGSSNTKDIKKLSGTTTINPSGTGRNDVEQGYRDTNYVRTKTDVDFTTDEAKQWEGWGTALKPATEFWTLARKPIECNTVAENVLKYGTGGINIDGSRIGERETEQFTGKKEGTVNAYGDYYYDKSEVPLPAGRFPSNVIFDEFTGKILDEQTGELKTTYITEDHKNNRSGDFLGEMKHPGIQWYDDSGGASRFFYCPKADNFERNKGLKDFEVQPLAASNQAKAELKRGNTNFEADGDKDSSWSDVKMRKNNHPTVKPIDLMRYLVKLITPKGGICLDPYCGSGTTLIGCKLELMKWVGIDEVEAYCKISEARVAAWNPDKYIPQTLF